MARLVFISTLIGGLLTGCLTRSGARREAQKAMFEEQYREEMEKQREEPAVWFRGDIRHPRVPWKEGLTLAEALEEAEYTWNWDPHLLTLTRAGQIHSVNIRRLLRGQENPELEPGDVIEVRH